MTSLQSQLNAALVRVAALEAQNSSLTARIASLEAADAQLNAKQARWDVINTTLTRYFGNLESPSTYFEAQAAFHHPELEVLPGYGGTKLRKNGVVSPGCC